MKKIKNEMTPLIYEGPRIINDFFFIRAAKGLIEKCSVIIKDRG